MKKYAVIFTTENGDISKSMFKDIAFFSNIKEAVSFGQCISEQFISETGLLCDFWIYQNIEDLEAET